MTVPASSGETHVSGWVVVEWGFGVAVLAFFWWYHVVLPKDHGREMAERYQASEASLKLALAQGQQRMEEEKADKSKKIQLAGVVFNGKSFGTSRVLPQDNKDEKSPDRTTDQVPTPQKESDPVPTPPQPEVKPFTDPRYEPILALAKEKLVKDGRFPKIYAELAPGDTFSQPYVRLNGVVARKDLRALNEFALENDVRIALKLSVTDDE